MILHVNFSDGSNPWVCFSDDRREIAEHWRDWMKYHPEEAQPVAYVGEYAVYPYRRGGGYHLMIRNYNDFDGDMHYNYVKHYKHLGHALAALERLGGEKN